MTGVPRINRFPPFYNTISSPGSGSALFGHYNSLKETPFADDPNIETRQEFLYSGGR
jgi:hypothetical protein